MQFLRAFLILFCLTAQTTVGTSQDVRRDAGEDYMVVINHEEQYSVWPRQSIDAAKYKPVVESCSLEKCQDYIEEVWTDMRPLSLRKEMASQDVDLDKTKFRVVINHEEQYSVVPVDTKIPRGWKPLKKTGSLSECQSHIKKVWTDMRPLSMREK